MQNTELADKLRKIAEELGHLQDDEYATLLNSGKYKQKARLLILEQYHEPGITPELKGRGMYKTICSCGKRSTFPKKYVDNNAIRDCGHVKEDLRLQRTLQLPPPREKRLEGRFKDYTGRIIGLLLVNSYRVDEYGEINWSCTCACGRQRELSLHGLRKSDSDKARYKNKVMTCGAQICEGLHKQGFTREQAEITLRELMLRGVSR